jgi:hypothetical protein
MPEEALGFPDTSHTYRINTVYISTYILLLVSTDILKDIIIYADHLN